MQNQNIDSIDNDKQMYEKFKTFMSGQTQPQQTQVIPTPKAKKQTTKNPKIQIVQAVQAPPPPPPIINDDTDNEIELKPKVKRQASEKQIANLQQGRERRNELRRQRAEEKRKQDEEYKKVVEQKIVKKAIQIKKKQIKQEKFIEPEPESDNETQIKSQPKRPQQHQYQPQPRPTRQIVFV